MILQSRSSFQLCKYTIISSKNRLKYFLTASCNAAELMPANTGVSRNLWSDLKLRGGLGFDFSFCQRILSSLSYIKEFYSSRVLSFFPYRCFLLTQLHGFGSLLCGVLWVLIAGVLTELPDSQGQAFCRSCVQTLGQKNTLAIWFYSRSLQPHGTTWLPKAHGGVPPQPMPLGRGGLWAALFFSVTLGFILSPLFPSSNTSLLYPVQGRHTGRVSRHSQELFEETSKGHTICAGW